jgi:hypothetical protein
MRLFDFRMMIGSSSHNAMLVCTQIIATNKVVVWSERQSSALRAIYTLGLGLQLAQRHASYRMPIRRHSFVGRTRAGMSGFFSLVGAGRRVNDEGLSKGIAILRQNDKVLRCMAQVAQPV